jgi:hypothetical protein
MLAVTGPESGLVLNSGGCYESIADLETVALAELADQISCEFTDPVVSLSAGEHREKSGDGL